MKKISKINLNIIKEQLYTEGLVNQLYTSIIDYGEKEVEAKTLMESILKEEKDKNMIQDIVEDFKLAPKFIFTFGTGIGAFYEPIDKLLRGSGLHLTEYQIYLLIITAFALMLNEVNSTKMVQKLKEDGIHSSLKAVMEYISNTKKLMNSVTKNVLGTVYSLTDILGFTSLLVPTMEVLSKIITEYGLTTNSLNVMLNGIILAASVYGIKSVIKKVKNKLS